MAASKLRPSTFRGWCVALALTLGGFAPEALAQGWQQVPALVGGEVSALLDAGGDGLFVATRGGGIFRSTDGGATWARRSDGLSRRGLDVTGLARNAGGVLFASTNSTSDEGGIYRSSDAGANWALVLNLNSFAETVFVGPTGDVFVGTGGFGAVQRSTDGGDTFGPVDTGLLNFGGFFTNVLQFASDGSDVFCINANEVYRFDPMGPGWVRIDNGIAFGAGLETFAVDGMNIYVATTQGVYKSTNAADFSLSNTGLEYLFDGIVQTARQTTGIALVAPDTLYVGTLRADNGETSVFRTGDAASSWSDVLPGEGRGTTALRSGGSEFVGTNETGLHRTTNGGNSFTSASTGLNAVYIDALVADGGNDTTLWVGSRQLDVATTDDAGQSFSTRLMRADGVVRHNEVAALAQDSGGRLYAGTDGSTDGGGVFRSTDDGATWVEKSNGLVNGAAVADTFQLSVATNDRLYRTSGLNLYASDDLADTWSLQTSLLQPSSLLAASNGDVYTTTTSLQRSTDGGMNFNPVSTGSFATFGIFEDDGGTLHAFDGVQSRTSTNGTTWSASSTGLNSTGIDLADDGSGTLYLAANAAANGTPGVYRSTDGGTTWQALNDGLASLEVEAVAVLGDGGVYAGTRGAGLFHLIGTGTFTVPEPGASALAAVAMMTLCALRPARRANQSRISVPLDSHEPDSIT